MLGYGWAASLRREKKYWERGGGRGSWERGLGRGRGVWERGLGRGSSEGVL